MAEKTFAEDAASEKSIAAKMLTDLTKGLPTAVLDGESIDKHDLIRENPVVKLALMSLEHIAQHGGKVDSSLIGMLSVNAKQESAALTSLMRDTPLGKDNLDHVAHATYSEISAEIAKKLLDSGLVQLPVVARGRVR